MSSSEPAAPPSSADVRDRWAVGRLGSEHPKEPEVVFGQVQEDPAVELAALARCEPAATVFCVGSGGCVALWLLSARPAAVHAVDINPAQIHLIELKRAAFRELSREDLVAALTSDAGPFYGGLRSSLSPQARAFWDARRPLLSSGLNHCGALDRKLVWMRRALHLLLGRRRQESMLGEPDAAAQRRFYHERWDDWRWKLLFRWGLSRPVLRLVYDRALLDGLPRDFARIMKEQVDAAFLGSPIRENGYLWETFLGRPAPDASGLPIYLQRPHHAIVREGLSRLNLACADAAEWLEACPPASIGFFALSNILEISAPDYRRRLALAIRRAARPGALVCIRFLVPAPREGVFPREAGLSPDEGLSVELARLDRSPFCRFLQLWRAA
jgi:S-adenosylmethionine-diacylglycerol 3-amino-3-carboxypropyl transferase